MDNAFTSAAMNYFWTDFREFVEVGCECGGTVWGTNGHRLQHRPLGLAQLSALLNTFDQVGKIAIKELAGNVGWNLFHFRQSGAST
jgi:hypothetical protein